MTPTPRRQTIRARLALASALACAGAAVSSPAGAGEPAAAATPRASKTAGAPRVRVVDVARFDEWNVLEGDPWSPSGSRLAVESRDRLGIWDAARPAEPPRPILEAEVDEVRWSPDGTWLCCRVRVANATQGRAVRLQFVPAAGGEPEYRIPNAAIGPWFWADDGFVYFWDGQTGERRRVEPPRAWRNQQPALPPHAEPQIVIAESGRRRRHPRALLFTPAGAGMEPVETALDSLVAPGGVQPWCRFRDPASGAPRWIVTFLGRGDAHTRVVDAAGRPGTFLGGTTAPTDVSVSATGAWGLQTHCSLPREGVLPTDQPNTYPTCKVEMFSTAGDWARPIDEFEASRAECDRTSPLVALASQLERGLRIVRIDVDPATRR
jgi:hypothetical protein